MHEELLKRLQVSLTGTVAAQADLAALNTFGIGGPATLLVEPASPDDIALTMEEARTAGLPLYVLGAGSNVIVPDEGVAGIVLRLAGGLDSLTLVDGTVVAEAGVSDQRLAEFALEHRLAGFEWIYDIPGSVGGAVFMNAGNADGEIADSCLWVDYVTSAGQVARCDGQALQFSYRRSIFQEDVRGIVWRTGLRPAGEASPDVIREKMEAIRDLRRCKFPEETLCAGSIFKRPPGHFAGKLIEEAGCGGLRVGGALVSPRHKGFIVNTGGATAHDVLALIDEVRQRVLDSSGVQLETEVETFAPFLEQVPH
jgi:UDP-N-acetylmuramate dehydrogenase